VRLDTSFAVFVTMNPMYDYRTVLPSNLKALFRPLAMMVPDYTLIAEVLLFVAGYKYAAKLAKKLVAVIKVGGWLYL
jgi:dynein heavy chain